MRTSLIACAKTLADSGGRALGAVISKFKNLKNVGYRTFETLYNAGVKPVIEYGSGVWGHISASCVNNVQNRAMRFYLGVHKCSPNHALAADVGWLSPRLSRYICRVRLWNRLVTMEETRLTKQIFEWDYNTSKRNWSRSMKSLFEELDISTMFDQKAVCDLPYVETKVREIMQESWKRQVIKKTKLRTFVSFKEEIALEPFVKHLTSRYARSAFTQFRHGILPLKIETGRFKNLAIEDRICELCQLNCIEDESHFLCICPLYSDVRVPLFDKGRNVIPNFDDLDANEKLILLMKNCWKDVSNFIVSAWKIRQNVLYH